MKLLFVLAPMMGILFKYDAEAKRNADLMVITMRRKEINK